MPIPGMQWDDVTVGKHRCEIVDAELGTSSQGNAMLIVRMLVDGSVSDMTTFSLLPQAIFKLRSFLIMLGFNKDTEPDPDDLTGLEFEGIYAEDNQGRVRLADWRRLPESDDDDDEEDAPAPKTAAKKRASGGARGFE